MSDTILPPLHGEGGAERRVGNGQGHIPTLACCAGLPLPMKGRES
jgi:hypothetical protein